MSRWIQKFNRIFRVMINSNPVVGVGSACAMSWGVSAVVHAAGLGIWHWSPCPIRNSPSASRFLRNGLTHLSPPSFRSSARWRRPSRGPRRRGAGPAQPAWSQPDSRLAALRRPGAASLTGRRPLSARSSKTGSRRSMIWVNPHLGKNLAKASRWAEGLAVASATGSETAAARSFSNWRPPERSSCTCSTVREA